MKKIHAALDSEIIAKLLVSSWVEMDEATLEKELAKEMYAWWLKGWEESKKKYAWGSGSLP